MLNLMLFILYVDMLYLFNKIIIKVIDNSFKPSSDLGNYTIESVQASAFEEECEDVSINEFDNRIESLKQELKDKRDKDNNIEIITESYEKEIYG